MDENITDVISMGEDSMSKSLDHLEVELKKIRAGKASPMMLGGITVEYYGSATPLDQVASVTAMDARTLIVKPWEKNMIQPIERAIIEANLGLNPQSDAEMVRIPIPSLTEARRKDLVKQAKGEGENAKIAIRRIRKNSYDMFKELKSEGVSEDMVKTGEKKIDELTNAYVSKVDEVIKQKEGEIMTV